MRTVGEILKKARIEKKLSLDEVEKNIKIRIKFLSALEENSWHKLPSLPYIKGFLKNYSLFLDLNPEEIIAIFRRQFRQQEKEPLLPEGLTHPLDEPLIKLTPKTISFVAVFFFFLFFFGYLFFQYRNLTNPPFLNIRSPREGEILKSDLVLITGKSDQDAVVSVNNQRVALNQDGQFTTSLNLSPGVNSILIESISKFGRKRSITRTVQVLQAD